MSWAFTNAATTEKVKDSRGEFWGYKDKMEKEDKWEWQAMFMCWLQLAVFWFSSTWWFPHHFNKLSFKYQCCTPCNFQATRIFINSYNPLFLSTAYQAYEDVQDMMDLPWLKHKSQSNHPQEALEWIRIDQFLNCLPRELKHMHSFLR